MSLSRVIEVAMGELKTTEYPPGSNKVRYNTAYYGREVQGDDYPWCVVFLWWVFQQAGERMAFFGGGQTASCRTMLSWYRQQGLTVPVSDIQPGDIVILNFSGTQDTQHCGLVLGVNSTDDNYINTAEGNTTPGEEKTLQANGGCVALKHRHRSQVVAVCRPQYKPDDLQPVDDVTGHWFTPSVEWAREKGLIKNYPDGSFKPNNPLTRAEACAMLERFYELLWDNDMR